MRPARFPAIAFALYTVLFSLIALGRHYSMAIGAYDLGIFTQSFWNTLHSGGFLFNQMEAKSHFGFHFSPIILACMPFFALWQRADCLIVCQTAVIALAIFPLYRIAERRYGPVAARVFVVLFLLYPPLHGVNYHEFHETAFAIPVYLFMFDFFERRRYAAMWLTIALALGVKEDQGFVIVVLGMLLIGLGCRAARRARRGEQPDSPHTAGELFLHGALTVAAGAAAYVVITHFVMPAFGGNVNNFCEDRFKYLGGSVQEILLSFLTRPGVVLKSLLMPVKLNYLLELLLPLALLSLRSPWILPAAPLFTINLLSAWGGMYSTNSHYAGALIPFIFYSAVRGYERFQKPGAPQPGSLRACPRALKACIVLTVIFMLVFDPAPLRIGRPLPIPGKEARATLHFMEKIPRDASLSTLGHVYPHLATRRVIWPRFHDGVECVFLDMTRGQLLGEVDYTTALASPAFAREYREALREGSLVLYRRVGP